MERVIVCLKPVPDPQAWDRLRLDPMTKTLVRDEIPNVINPLDKHALEAALEVKDAYGAEVVLLSMAPAHTLPVLREALAMGADRAVLLSDQWFAGSDTLATARILATAIRRLEPFDLVCCGNFTLDGSTAQVPSQIAELLGIPNIMHVSAMEFRQAGPLLVTQKIEQGLVKLEAEPPLLLSFIKEANKPRYSSFLEILAAETREIAVWTRIAAAWKRYCEDHGLTTVPVQEAQRIIGALAGISMGLDPCAGPNPLDEATAKKLMKCYFTPY